MPAKSEKQKKFFGAVMGAKKGEKGASGKAKKVAKEMPEKKIKKFLKKEEDEESVSKQLKDKGKATIKGPEVKKRKKFAPKTKVEKPKKGKGTYDRKKLKESKDISLMVDCIISKNYSEADKYLKAVVEQKIQAIIEAELTTPLFN